MFNKPLEELKQIVSAGGGMTVSAVTHPVEDLIQLAIVASRNLRARLYIEGASNMETNDAVKIASAGKGAVVFV